MQQGCDAFSDWMFCALFCRMLKLGSALLMKFGYGLREIIVLIQKTWLSELLESGRPES